MARNEQLGTVFSEATWGEMQRQTCPAADAFQVDIRLVHVHPTCKKGECEPRDMRWANLCTSAARFRTKADNMRMLPEETFGDNAVASGLIDTDRRDPDHTKAYWRLSAALPFGNDDGPLPVSGESLDGIFYRETIESEADNWLEVNFDLESTLQPWSSSSQVHAVRSASLGIVWTVPGRQTENWTTPKEAWQTGSDPKDIQDQQVGVIEKVPSRIAFEGDTHGWQA